MKSAKSYGIVTLLAVFFISLILAVFAGMSLTVKADGVAAKDYFNYTGEKTVFEEGDVTFSEVTFDTDPVWVAAAKLYDNSQLNVKNELVFDDFAVKFYLPENFNEIMVTVKTPSYIVTGNPKTEGDETTYETTVNNEVKFTLSGTNLIATFNGNQVDPITFSNTEPVTLYFSTDSTYNLYYLIAKVSHNGIDREFNVPDSADMYYYLIDPTRTLVGSISFSGSTGETIYIESFNQKVAYADNKFEQTFEMNDGRFAKTAYARVTLPKDLFNYKFNEGLVLFWGYQYNFSFTEYSFLGSDNATYALIGDDIISNSTYFAFKTKSDGAGDAKSLQIKRGIDDNAEIIESFDFYVFDMETDNQLPKYVDIEDIDPVPSIAFDSFKAYFNDLVAKATDPDDPQTSFTVEKAKFYNIVSDDYSSLDKMTYKVMYWYNNGSNSSSAGTIQIGEAGHYRAIFLFTDASDNAMVEQQFFRNSDADPTLEVYGVYKAFIFEFDIEFDGTLKITKPSAGDGYVGSKYTLSNFTIDGSNYSTEYKLFYSKTNIDEDADGWNEIIASSEATDETVKYGIFTYDQIKAFGYNGSTSFTPTRTGYYKITCTANSSLTANTVSESAKFVVKEQTKTVTPDDHWLENNVWSVVFLSVGTLSLVGIIVLLFIKPKDEDAEQ